MGNKQGKTENGVPSNQRVESQQNRNTPVGLSPTSTHDPGTQGASEQGKSSVAVRAKPNISIPIDQFNKFLNCLKGMPFEIDENEFQNMAAHLQSVKFNKGEIILEKGKRGKGIYLVVKGYCNVSADSDIIIRVIGDEDFFGEVSSFYDTQCTATISAGENGTKLLWLPEHVLADIGRPVDVPLINWYVTRKYIDLEGTSIKDKVIAGILIEAIKEAPPFHGWSLGSVDLIAKNVITENGIICYSAGSEIFSIGETDTNGWLLINGEIELLSGAQQSLEILNAGRNGLWFGDEQLFCYTERQIMAKANTPCIIATFSTDTFQGIPERFAIEQAKLMELSLSWKRFIENQDRKLHDKYAGQLGTDMTQLVLRKSALLSLCPVGMIYRTALNVVHRHLRKDQLVFLEDEPRDKMFVVFMGVISVESDSKVSAKQLEISEFYYPTEIEPEDVIARALEESIIGLIDVMSFKAVQDLYPEGTINWDRTANIVGHC